jgi:tetratricopeptide (TPR) repeat protein
VSKKDDDAEAHNMIGLCKYREEDYSGAIKKFSRSIELAPKNAQYLDNRASAKEHIQDFEGAIADYSASIGLYPSDPEVYYKRGLVKIHTSKKLEGCMDLGTASEMKHEGAKEAIRKNCN